MAAVADVLLAAAGSAVALASVMVAVSARAPVDACGTTPAGVLRADAVLAVAALAYLVGMPTGFVAFARSDSATWRKAARVVLLGTVPAAWVIVVAWGVDKSTWFCF